MWSLLILRVATVVLVIAGLYCLMQTVMRFAEYGPYELYGSFWVGSTLGTLVPGVGLVFFSAKLVRWLVPVPRFECPQCGYMLRHLASSRCPECGIDLGEPPAVNSGST